MGISAKKNGMVWRAIPLPISSAISPVQGPLVFSPGLLYPQAVVWQREPGWCCSPLSGGTNTCQCCPWAVSCSRNKVWRFRASGGLTDHINWCPRAHLTSLPSQPHHCVNGWFWLFQKGAMASWTWLRLATSGSGTKWIAALGISAPYLLPLQFVLICQLHMCLGALLQTQFCKSRALNYFTVQVYIAMSVWPW